jgi:hypothetical protein
MINLSCIHSCCPWTCGATLWSTAWTIIRMLAWLIMWSMIVVMPFPIASNTLWAYMMNWVIPLRRVGFDCIHQTECNQTAVAFVETLGKQTPRNLLQNLCRVRIVCNKISCTMWIWDFITSDRIHGAMLSKCEETLLATNHDPSCMSRHEKGKTVASNQSRWTIISYYFEWTARTHVFYLSSDTLSEKYKKYHVIAWLADIRLTSRCSGWVIFRWLQDKTRVCINWHWDIK